MTKAGSTLQTRTVYFGCSHVSEDDELKMNTPEMCTMVYDAIYL